jgi:hypothetical protein
MEMTAIDINTDEDVIRYFEWERDRLERDPLWRAAWLTAQNQGHETFQYDGVEWFV